MIKCGDIIAIGGGGFGRNPNNPIIEQYILNQSKQSCPKICFIPSSPNRNVRYLKGFYNNKILKRSVGNALPQEDSSKYSSDLFIEDFCVLLAPSSRKRTKFT